jgi:threonine synthase
MEQTISWNHRHLKCFGPLEVTYDYAGVREVLTREAIEKRPKTLWRHRELLPLEGEPTVDCTLDAHRSCALTGSEGDRIQELYLKMMQSVIRRSPSKTESSPWHSPARSDLKPWLRVDGQPCKFSCSQRRGCRHAHILIQTISKRQKSSALRYMVRILCRFAAIMTTSIDCTEIAGRYPWAFVNDLRPFYAEGSKTVGFEIAEQRMAGTDVVVVQWLAVR